MNNITDMNDARAIFKNKQTEACNAIVNQLLSAIANDIQNANGNPPLCITTKGWMDNRIIRLCIEEMRKKGFTVKFASSEPDLESDPRIDITFSGWADDETPVPVDIFGCESCTSTDINKELKLCNKCGSHHIMRI